MAMLLAALVGLPYIRLTEQIAWSQNGVEICRDAGKWVVKSRGLISWSAPSWGPHEVFHDAKSHSLAIFGGNNYEIYILNEKGVKAGVIPVGNVGITRT